MGADTTTAGPEPADLTGRVALVTGGGRGIGRAIARALARAGARVVAASRTRAEVEETAALIVGDGGIARAATADVTDGAAVETLVRGALAEFGRIDVLVNDAGSFAALGPVWEVDPERWRRDVVTNLVGAFLCARAVLPGMLARRDGVIINLSGGGAAGPAPFYTGYASSKAGVLRFTDSLAAEVAPHHIFVYALGPGLVRTAMTEHLMRDPNVQAYNPGFFAGMTGGGDVPAERAGHLAVRLAALRDPRLSGRSFHVDDPDGVLVKDADEIARRDLRTLRLRL